MERRATEVSLDAHGSIIEHYGQLAIFRYIGFPIPWSELEGPCDLPPVMVLLDSDAIAVADYMGALRSRLRPPLSQIFWFFNFF